MSNSLITIGCRNTEVPFFPSYTWQFLNTDLQAGQNVTLWTSTLSNTTGAFNWIQAFFSPQLTVAPQLVIYSGNTNSDGTLQGSLIQFAYSGEIKKIKGIGLFTSAKDIRGVIQTSTPIGATATTQLSGVTAYGGLY